MASIQLDGLTIDLTDSLSLYDMSCDEADIEVLGDNTQKLHIKVGHDSLTIRAHFITLLDVMNAIAEANDFKVVAVVPDQHIKDAINHSEYFDSAGVYHVNTPKAISKAKPVSRKAYIRKTGMLDFGQKKGKS